MEIPRSRWPTADRQRGARPYPKNELRKPALGCAAYRRRASEARLRRRPGAALDEILAAIGRERRAGDQAGLVGGQEHHATRDLLRLAQPADRDQRQDALLQHVLRQPRRSASKCLSSSSSAPTR